MQRSFTDRDDTVWQVMNYLQTAQERMQSQVDSKRKESSFEVDKWASVKLCAHKLNLCPQTLIPNFQQGIMGLFKCWNVWV